MAAVNALTDDTLSKALIVTSGLHEEHRIWWRIVDGELALFVNCSDVFFWGSADVEDITNDNIELLASSLADATAAIEPVNPGWDGGEGYLLFCSRARGERPQGAMYPHLHSATWPLFDEAGKPRKTGTGNPYPHPDQRTDITGGRETNKTTQSNTLIGVKHETDVTQTLNITQMRQLLATFCWDSTDYLRWEHVSSEGSEALFTAHLIEFDAWGAGSICAAQITDGNIDTLCEAYKAADQKYGDADGWFATLWISRQLGLKLDTQYINAHVESTARPLFIDSNVAHNPNEIDLETPTKLEELRANRK